MLLSKHICHPVTKLIPGHNAVHALTFTVLPHTRLKQSDTIWSNYSSENVALSKRVEVGLGTP